MGDSIKFGRISMHSILCYRERIHFEPGNHLNTTVLRLPLGVYCNYQRRQSGLKSGDRGSGLHKFQIFSGNFTKNILIFPGKFPKKFDFFQAISQKYFDFPGKNWPFTATSEQIILFLFQSHHFRTYFLYMIRYNDRPISRPVHDPLQPPRHPCLKSGGRDPLTPRIDAPALRQVRMYHIATSLAIWPLHSTFHNRLSLSRCQASSLFVYLLLSLPSLFLRRPFLE